MEDPESFGIAWLGEGGEIVSIREKPSKPDSNLAITGLYLYTSKVFDMIDTTLEEVGYSERGELEISDINRFFMERGEAKGVSFDCHWADCGTIDALLETSILMKDWDLGKWLVSEGE